MKKLCRFDDLRDPTSPNKKNSTSPRSIARALFSPIGAAAVDDSEDMQLSPRGTSATTPIDDSAPNLDSNFDSYLSHQAYHTEPRGNSSAEISQALGAGRRRYSRLWTAAPRGAEPLVTRMSVGVQFSRHSKPVFRRSRASGARRAAKAATAPSAPNYRGEEVKEELAGGLAA